MATQTHAETLKKYWDPRGSFHWGFYDDPTNPADFLDACDRMTEVMYTRASMNADSEVLDLCAGLGRTAMWIAQRVKRVDGVELDGDKVQRALMDNRAPNLRFFQGDAAYIDQPDQAYTHVICQAAAHRVNDYFGMFSEVQRVLKPGGIFVFDIITRWRIDVSESTQTHVFDRLDMKTTTTVERYGHALAAVGLDVRSYHDLSVHLGISYQQVHQRALQACLDGSPELQPLVPAYAAMADAIKRADIGWALFECRKV